MSFLSSWSRDSLVLFLGEVSFPRSELFLAEEKPLLVELEAFEVAFSFLSFKVELSFLSSDLSRTVDVGDAFLVEFVGLRGLVWFLKEKFDLGFISLVWFLVDRLDLARLVWLLDFSVVVVSVVSLAFFLGAMI